MMVVMTILLVMSPHHQVMAMTLQPEVMTPEVTEGLDKKNPTSLEQR